MNESKARMNHESIDDARPNCPVLLVTKVFYRKLANDSLVDAVVMSADLPPWMMHRHQWQGWTVGRSSAPVTVKYHGHEAFATHSGGCDRIILELSSLLDPRPDAIKDVAENR